MVSGMLLFLSDVSGSEVFLIFLVILIFFGPKSIPGIARSLGKAFRQIKDASAEVQNEIRKSGADMKSDMNVEGIFTSITKDIHEPIEKEMQTMDQTFANDLEFRAPQPFTIPTAPSVPMDQQHVEETKNPDTNEPGSEGTK